MIDVATTKFFPCVFKWQKVLRNLIIFYLIAQKCMVEALNRYEKHSLAERRKIKPFLSVKNGSEKKFCKKLAVEQVAI